MLSFRGRPVELADEPLERRAHRRVTGRSVLVTYEQDQEILGAWHEREVREHLEQLRILDDRAAPALEHLAWVMEAYVDLAHAEAAGDGQIRGDVPAGELASYALHALQAAADQAAADQPAGAACGRLVTLVPEASVPARAVDVMCIAALVIAASPSARGPRRAGGPGARHR